MNESQFDHLRLATLVGMLSRTWRKTIDQRLAQYQLTEATWMPLLLLSRLDQPIRQKELAAMLSLDSSSLVRVLGQLEQQGLIQRGVEQDDRRAKATQITEQGRALIQHIEGLSTALEAEIQKQLNMDEVKITRKVLQQIYLSLQAQQQSPVSGAVLHATEQ